MAQATNKLTTKAVKAAADAGKPRKLFDGGGLFLHIQAGGAYWRLKYRVGGREKLLSLGVYPQITLKKARERRQEAKDQLAEGKDPSAERKAARLAQREEERTFRAVAEEWLDTQRKTLNPGTLRVARRRLETWAFPEIGGMPVDTIEPPDILKLLRRIESQGKHETAHRLRQRIGQAFRYAIATGRVSRDPTADLHGALAPVPTTSRAAITEPKAVGKLMAALHGYDGQATTRAALQLLALTFVRPGELRKATWAEIDLEGATWRIPGERMKMRRDHIVPLAPQAVEALELLRPLTEHRPFVFEGVRRGRPLSENTLNAALRTLGYDSDAMTPHGFRAMASTLLHELGWPPEVIELQLAHAQRSQVAAAYNRSARLEERRRMMAAWADYLDTLRAGDSNVVTLGRTRRDTPAS